MLSKDISRAAEQVWDLTLESSLFTCRLPAIAGLPAILLPADLEAVMAFLSADPGGTTNLRAVTALSVINLMLIISRKSNAK